MTLIDAGFSYDSSVFPVLHDNYGIPDAALEPFEISAPSGAHAAWSSRCRWRNGVRFKLPVSGGGYFRIFPYWLTRSSLRASTSATAGPSSSTCIPGRSTPSSHASAPA